ncbi:MAG TPA: hypothetical protein VNU26_10170 [Mycobacteriales bacterium]|nr:hypothetical protein [Mycobacteriales bacterium]
MRRVLVVMLTLLACLCATPGTAAADAPIGPAQAWRGHFPDAGEQASFPCHVGPGEDDVVLFSDEASFHGKDLIFPVNDGTGQAFLGHITWSFRAQHQNLDTLERFTVQGHGVFRELSSQLLGSWDGETWTPPEGWVAPTDEKGDPVEISGPVYRFTSVEVLHFTVRDEFGRVLHKASARIRWVDEYDTLGDGVPGAEFLRGEDPVLLAGSWPFFDFCELALS